jgi:hypothetical protein
MSFILQRKENEGNTKLRFLKKSRNLCNYRERVVVFQSSQIEVLTSSILIDKMSANWGNGMIQKKGGEEKKETFFDICKGG